MDAIGDGITPAWAGKSPPLYDFPEPQQDHPRVGGEKIASWTVHKVSMGSPPRGRGKVVHLSVSIFLPGITPAWAGKRKKINPGQHGN